MTLRSDPELIYKKIVEHASDAILFADRDGIIRLWNTGAEMIFGFTAQEAVGQSLDLIIPEKLRQRHWEGFQRVMASGHTRYGSELLKVPATRKDGKRLSIEFTVILIHDRENQIVGIASIIRDASERWQHEKDLKARLKFLEDRLEPKEIP